MHVRTLDIDSKRFRRKYRDEKLPESLIQQKPKKVSGRIYTARKNGGIKTQRTMTQYMGLLFTRNELEAIRGKPLTRGQLRYNIENEFPHLRVEIFANHRETLGTYQRDYNRGKLYASQPRPCLISLRYDEDGFIVASSRETQYMSFDECRELCAKFMIADPRFFTYKELQDARKAASLNQAPFTEWSIPTHEEVKALEKKTGGVKLYNSLKFPKGLGIQTTVE